MVLLFVAIGAVVVVELVVVIVVVMLLAWSFMVLINKLYLYL